MPAPLLRFVRSTLHCRRQFKGRFFPSEAPQGVFSSLLLHVANCRITCQLKLFFYVELAAPYWNRPTWFRESHSRVWGKLLGIGWILANMFSSLFFFSVWYIRWYVFLVNCCRMSYIVYRSIFVSLWVIYRRCTVFICVENTAIQSQDRIYPAISASLQAVTTHYEQYAPPVPVRTPRYAWNR